MPDQRRKWREYSVSETRDHFLWFIFLNHPYLDVYFDWLTRCDEEKRGNMPNKARNSVSLSLRRHLEYLFHRGSFYILYTCRYSFWNGSRSNHSGHSSLDLNGNSGIYGRSEAYEDFPLFIRNTGSIGSYPHNMKNSRSRALLENIPDSSPQKSIFLPPFRWWQHISEGGDKRRKYLREHWSC